MATQSPTELEAFYQYLGEKLKNGASEMSVEESVQQFRAYQRELEQLRKEVLPALSVACAASRRLLTSKNEAFLDPPRAGCRPIAPR